MLTKDTLYTGEEVRKGLSEGISKVARAVGGTMGTGGGNTIIEALQSPGHYLTNDGYSIANSVRLADPIENMGKNILLESINRANKQSGDGSSTTCVLTAALIKEGQKVIGETIPMELKRSLESCIPLIEESIKFQTREITVDEVGAVAAISAEDEQIGQTIQDIYKEIGKDGIIHWDISKTTEDTYTIGSGITVEGAGFYSPYMCDATESGQSTNQIRLKNPKVLITKQKITTASEFELLGAQLSAKSIQDIIVFCDEVDPLVQADLVKTRMVRGFRFILVKMPTLWKDQWYEDLALASGATLVDPVLGLTIKTTKLDQLGTFDHITVTKDETYIDGIKDMSEHVSKLQAENTDDSLLRASRLNTKTARYFVGAQSDSALSYRRLKVEDAISAAWQALNGGVVIGGGLALVEASKNIPVQALQEALQAPYEQIKANMGHGYTKEDLEAQKVYDPANIVLNAAKNAISVAAAILTADTLVLLPREEQQAMPNIPGA